MKPSVRRRGLHGLLTEKDRQTIRENAYLDCAEVMKGAIATRLCEAAVQVTVSKMHEVNSIKELFVIQLEEGRVCREIAKSRNGLGACLTGVNSAIVRASQMLKGAKP